MFVCSFVSLFVIILLLICACTFSVLAYLCLHSMDEYVMLDFFSLSLCYLLCLCEYFWCVNFSFIFTGEIVNAFFTLLCVGFEYF